MSSRKMRRSLVLFSSIFAPSSELKEPALKDLPPGRQLAHDIPDRRSRLSFDLHPNRDHSVSPLSVLRGLLHHVAVMRAVSHEVAAAGYQIGAPEFSRHFEDPPADSCENFRAGDQQRIVLIVL